MRLQSCRSPDIEYGCLEVREVSEIPPIIKAYRKQNRFISDSKGCQRYYAALEKLQASKKDANARLRYAMMCLSYIEPFIDDMKRQFGEIPPVIPAIPEACYFHGINGAQGQLENIRDLVRYFPDLSNYMYGVNEGFAMLELAKSTRTYLKENPGTQQNKLKKAIGAENGRLLSRVVHYMELAGQIRRERQGKTHALFLLS